MARLWGGSSKLHKDECIALITQSLKDPAIVKTAIAGLKDDEVQSLLAWAGFAIEDQLHVIPLK